MVAAERVAIDDIQAWLAVHGDEYEFTEPFYEAVQHEPIPGTDVDIANRKAHEAHVRSVEENLAFCFTRPPDRSYESKLVPGILHRSITKGLVVDLHENLFSDQDYAFIGPRVYPHVLGFIALLKIEDVMVSKDGMFGCLPNTTLVDIAPESPRYAVDYWRALFAEVLNRGLEAIDPRRLNLFAHTNLAPEERDQIGALGQAFEVMQEVPGAAQLLKAKGPVYAQFGCGPDYEGHLEVVSPINPTDIQTKKGILHIPTLKAA